MTFEDKQSFEARLAGGTSKDSLGLAKTLSDVILCSGFLFSAENTYSVVLEHNQGGLGKTLSDVILCSGFLFSAENTYSVVLKHQPRWTLI